MLTIRTNFDDAVVLNLFIDMENFDQCKDIE